MVSPAKDVSIKSIIHGIIAHTSVMWVQIFNLIPKLMWITMVSYSTLMYIGSDFSSSSWTYVDHHITIAKLFGSDILLNLFLCFFSPLIFFPQLWPQLCITLLLGPTYQLTINTLYLPTYLPTHLTYPPIYLSTLPIYLPMYSPNPNLSIYLSLTLIPISHLLVVNIDWWSCNIKCKYCKNLTNSYFSPIQALNKDKLLILNMNIVIMNNFGAFNSWCP